MKKIIILVLMFAMFIVGSSNKVNADVWEGYYDDFTVSTASTGVDFVMTFEAYIYDGATSIDITIPVSELHRYENDVYEYTLVLMTEDLALIDSIYWKELFGEERLDGDFHIDFHNLGIFDNTSLDIGYIKIYVPQANTYTLDSTEMDDYLLYLEGADSITQNYDIPDYYYTYAWSSSFYTANLTDTIPSGVDAISFRGLGGFYTNEFGSYSSSIKLYDDTDALLETIYLTDIDASLGEFILIIPYEEWAGDVLSYFTLTLYVRDTFITIEALSSYNDSISVSYSVDALRTIHWISQGVEVHTEDVILPTSVTPYEVDPLPTGYHNEYWTNLDGTEFPFDNLTLEDYPSRDIYAYAFYTYIPTYVDPDAPTEEVLNTNNPFYYVFTDLGWDADTGYMLIFFAVVVVVTVVLIGFKVHMLGILLTDFLVFILFSYWGMIPSYLSLIVYIIFGVVGAFTLTQLGGGDQNE